MEVTEGTRVAERYVVERALAKGGMGSVFVARDEQMDVRVALKITAAGGAAQDELARRFAREARIGGRLGSKHQGFVRSLGWGRVDGVQLYLVLDLVDGGKPLDLRTGTLAERLGRWRRAAELVAVAHQNGVIHRDLKPSNFLQAPDGSGGCSIHLTDFGLAKVLDEKSEEPEQTSLTATGIAFGTPPYMPPEQLEDSKHVDRRADVYALGCMLFEAAALRLPYPGPTPTAILGAHLKVRAGVMAAPRPRDLDPTLPLELDQACADALELEVERRCPSIEALFAALDGVAITRLEPSPGKAPSLGALVTTPPDSALPSILPTGDGVPTDRPGRSAPARPAVAAGPRSAPGRAVAAGGLLLLVAGGAILADVGGLRSRLSPRPAPPPVRPVDGHGTPTTTGTPPPTSTGTPPPTSTGAPPPATTTPPPSTEATPPTTSTEASPYDPSEDEARRRREALEEFRSKHQTLATLVARHAGLTRGLGVDAPPEVVAARAALAAADGAAGRPDEALAALAAVDAATPPLQRLVDDLERALAAARAPAQEGRTPLHAAAEAGDATAFRLALREGGDPKAKDARGRTPLHLAARAGRGPIVELLLAAPGVAVDDPDGAGRTPLHAAAAGGHAEPIGALLARGARVAARDGAGDTPLHLAARAGSVAGVALLLEAGAEPRRRNDKGFLPVDLASAPAIREQLRGTTR